MKTNTDSVARLASARAKRDRLAAKYPVDYRAWRAGRYYWPEMDKVTADLDRAFKATQS